MSGVSRKASSLAYKISSANDVVIVAHRNLDGDALGSMMGLTHLIKKNFYNKSVHCFYDGELTGFVRGLMSEFDGCKHISEMKQDSFDLGFFLDTSKLRMLGGARKLIDLNMCKNTIKIDHHHGSDPYANQNFIDVNVSSTSECIYHIARINKWGIDAAAAKSLYVGISTDTVNFSKENMSFQTEKVVRHLKKIAGDVEMLNSPAKTSYPYDSRKTDKLIELMEIIDLNPEIKMALLYIPPHMRKSVGKVSRIQYDLSNLAVEYSIIVSKINNYYMSVSMRSRTKSIIGFVKNNFNGSGIPHAASFNVRSADYGYVRKMLIEKMKQEVK